MLHCRPVFTLLAVISTVGVQFSTLCAQTKITIGYAAVSPRTTPLYIAQEQGIFAKYGLDAKIVLFRGAPTLVASLISGEMEVGVYRWHVGGGRRRAGQLPPDSFVDLQHAHAYDDGSSQHQGSRNCAASASAFRIWAAARGCTPCWPWSMSASNRSATISTS